MAEPSPIGADAVEAVEQCCAKRFRQLEESVRRSPGRYVAGAAVLGYLVQLLPVGCILGGLFRLLLAAVRPALLILGILKVVECARQKCAVREALVRAKREELEPLLDSPAGPSA
ncbi:hypothetical protein BH09VER1_BH09VER1_35100 [soil metagenome]